MFVHENNLFQKENHKTKYLDPKSKSMLIEIRKKYNEWKEANTILKGPTKDIAGTDKATLEKRVKLLNEYKDFLDQQKYAEHFDSRSNLHSSVLEEFMYYLFRDLVSSISSNALIGKSHSFKDIFFRASNYQEMLIKPNTVIEKKDHDFAIGCSISAELTCKGPNEPETRNWDIPAVAVECKTYLDKTMLQDVSTAAEQIKHKNPNARYIAVAEWLKLSDDINLKKYKIDQIYVLRKQKNTDREYRYRSEYKKNPIYSDVVEHLFNDVRVFLTTDWESGLTDGLGRGFLL